MPHQGSYTARINRVMDHIDAHLDEKLDLAGAGARRPVLSFSLSPAVSGADRARRSPTGSGGGGWRWRPDGCSRRPDRTALGHRARGRVQLGRGLHAGVSRPLRRHAHRLARRRFSFVGRRATASRSARFVKATARPIKRSWTPFSRIRSCGPRATFPAPKETRWTSRSKRFPTHASLTCATSAPTAARASPPPGNASPPGARRPGLMQPRRRMFGVCLDDPTITPPEKCRYDCAVEVGRGLRPRGARHEIGIETVAGGRYACASFQRRRRRGPRRLEQAWSPTGCRRAATSPTIARRSRSTSPTSWSTRRPARSPACSACPSARSDRRRPGVSGAVRGCPQGASMDMNEAREVDDGRGQSDSGWVPHGDAVSERRRGGRVRSGSSRRRSAPRRRSVRRCPTARSCTPSSRSATRW